jgi:hypothetical protein
VDDLGAPIAYLGLEEGTPVFDRRGERVGVVEHVLADSSADIFEGVIVHTLPLPGKHVVADVEQIAGMHERGVVLTVDGDDLHAPIEEPQQPSDGDDEPLESPLQARLRRAWDWLSGRR